MNLRLDDYLVSEVADCLASDDEEDVLVGLRFAECLGTLPDFRRHSCAVYSQMGESIRNHLSHRNPAISFCSIGAFVAFRNCYPDFREVMLSLLRLPNVQIQSEALAHAPAFLNGSHVFNLQTFRNDTTVCQASYALGGWRYVMRDLALEAAEKIAGRSFECGTNSEMRNSKTVNWRC